MDTPPRKTRSSRELSISRDEFNRRFALKEIINTGTFSVIRRALDQSNQKEVAVKIIQTSKLGTEDDVNRELDALKVIHHEKCTQLIAYMYGPSAVYIVLELAEGEALLQWMLRKRRCTELEAAIIIHQIITGVGYLHSIGIVHRDLKLENLVFGKLDDIHTLQIIDFGLSKMIEENGELSAVCGSPQYVAPEILSRPNSSKTTYTRAVDFWSIGVIMYMLLCGYPPFENDKKTSLFNKIMKAQYSFEKQPWNEISQEAKDAVSALLEIEPENRMDFEVAMSSPFIVKYQRLYK